MFSDKVIKDYKFLISEVAGEVPGVDQLPEGVLAINVADNAWYMLRRNPTRVARFNGLLPSASQQANYITTAQLAAALGEKFNVGTPLNAMSAYWQLELSGADPSIGDGDTVTIGDELYVFVAALSGVASLGEVLIGANDSATLDNLYMAITNTGASYGVTHWCLGSSLVGYIGRSATTFTVEHLVKGMVGTDLVCTTDIADAAWTLARPGLDGTIGDAGTIYVDQSLSNELEVYMAALANGIHDANWVNLVRSDEITEFPVVLKYEPLIPSVGTGTLTIGTNPVEGATVTIGDIDYKFRAAIGAGAEASKGLLFSAVAANNETVTIGERVYTFKDVVAAANEVLVEADIVGCVNNLVAAINAGAGAGVKYGTGTVAHADVTAANSLNTTVVATAKVKGFAGNAIVIGETCGNAAWDGGAVLLSGGVDPQAAYDVLIGVNVEASIDNLVLAITKGAGEGVNYGTGTIAHPEVTAVKASPATMTITTLIAGSAYIPTTETLADGSWGDAQVMGSQDGTVAEAGTIAVGNGKVFISLQDSTINSSYWQELTIKKYKEFTAFITQAGVAAPTLSVMGNDFGEFTAARTAAGVYTLTLADPEMTMGLTVPSDTAAMYWTDATGNKFFLQQTSATVMMLTTKNPGDADTDGLLSGTLIQIRTYRP